MLFLSYSNGLALEGKKGKVSNIKIRVRTDEILAKVIQFPPK